MFVLHQRINKIFWSPIIDPIVFVKIGKWKPYYFFVCAIVPGERTGPILFADQKNLLDADEDTNMSLCEQCVWFGYSNSNLTVLLSPAHHRHRIFRKDNLRTATNTSHPIIAILDSLLLRWVENNKHKVRWLVPVAPLTWLFSFMTFKLRLRH